MRMAGAPVELVPIRLWAGVFPGEITEKVIGFELTSSQMNRYGFEILAAR
jgi:hypothetical protein